MPIEDDANIVSLSEGLTPMADVLLGGRKTKVKLEHLSPTGSFKDRGASVLISRLKELRIPGVVEDSSGNAGAAIAAYCSEVDIECTVYAPETIRPDKVARIESRGAQVRLVGGTREDAADAALAAAESTYYASHVWNPYFLQGTKTFAYETCEQLGWRAPDTVVLPVGNGTLLLGAFKGFEELLALGFIDTMPKLIAVQSSECDPLARAYAGDSEKPRTAKAGATVADGIAVAAPLRGRQILEAVRQSKGSFISVDDAEIEAAREEICKLGYFIEPTAAAAPAAIIYHKAGAGVIVTALSGAGGKPGAGKAPHGDRNELGD
jgi:threonine synthase